MAPKKNDTAPGNINHGQRPEGQNAEWVELRTTLLAMQETIQSTIHHSIQELGEALFTRLDDVVRTRHNNRPQRDNPFAEQFADAEVDEDEDHRRFRRVRHNERQ